MKISQQSRAREQAQQSPDREGVGSIRTKLTATPGVPSPATGPRAYFIKKDLEGAIHYVLHEQGEPMAVYAGSGVTRPDDCSPTEQSSDRKGGGPYLVRNRARKQPISTKPAYSQDHRSLTVAALPSGARRRYASTSGFTMMEIAICLAVIGVALVGIIGVLPIGMNVQQSNRQETIINEDASVFVDAIRNGTMGYDDLTNYVYAITNYWAKYEPGGPTNTLGVNGYTFGAATVDPNYLSEYRSSYNVPVASMARPLTNAAIIIGLMSTPEYLLTSATPAAGIYYIKSGDLVYSNHIVVYCHSISGPAIEKPPQDNPILQQDSFSYRIFCVNASDAPNTNDYINDTITAYDTQMLGALHDLRLTFEWPQLPNGNVGSGRQTFRTLVAGQLLREPSLSPITFPFSTIWYDSNLWSYASQTFTNSPP
ncbi:MAG TPA: prepilin-type N-terminal cleavage/methylation domain-containing protein [Verrucomicrobiae bacterium]|jgi:prepilin-type N-terminal cleavage/methylation domain-containing protein|nr:prepilin-type N-terminal cleavage/methylation domain-containing protein [Verrucomicrobiae bacterium]